MLCVACIESHNVVLLLIYVVLGYSFDVALSHKNVALYRLRL